MQLPDHSDGLNNKLQSMLIITDTFIQTLRNIRSFFFVAFKQGDHKPISNRGLLSFEITAHKKKDRNWSHLSF
jgi:hypothetical protein